MDPQKDLIDALKKMGATPITPGAAARLAAASSRLQEAAGRASSRAASQLADASRATAERLARGAQSAADKLKRAALKTPQPHPAGGAADQAQAPQPRPGGRKKNAPRS